MDIFTFKRKKFLPFLKSKKHRILFMVLTIYLILGVSSLIVTMFYLIGHFNQADNIIKYCIPGFVMGISSAIIYFIGYESMISERQDKKRLHLS
jgi:ABC-type glycerol-3-phosphate transport system permease component